MRRLLKFTVTSDNTQYRCNVNNNRVSLHKIYNRTRWSHYYIYAIGSYRYTVQYNGKAELHTNMSITKTNTLTGTKEFSLFVDGYALNLKSINMCISYGYRTYQAEYIKKDGTKVMVTIERA